MRWGHWCARAHDESSRHSLMNAMKWPLDFERRQTNEMLQGQHRYQHIKYATYDRSLLTAEKEPWKFRHHMDGNDGWKMTSLEICSDDRLLCYDGRHRPRESIRIENLHHVWATVEVAHQRMTTAVDREVNLFAVRCISSRTANVAFVQLHTFPSGYHLLEPSASKTTMNNSYPSAKQVAC